MDGADEMYGEHGHDHLYATDRAASDQLWGDYPYARFNDIFGTDCVSPDYDTVYDFEPDYDSFTH